MKAFPTVETFPEHLPCTRVNMCGYIKTANKHRSCDTNAVPVPATAVPNVYVHRLPLFDIGLVDDGVTIRVVKFENQDVAPNELNCFREIYWSWRCTATIS